MTEMPQDPFTPPEELVSVMKGLSHIYSAGLLAGLPEHIATDFIARVYFLYAQLGQAATSPEK